MTDKEFIVFAMLVSYRYSELCASSGVDGLWISNMIKLLDEMVDIDLSREDDGVIATDLMYDMVEEIAYKIYKEREKEN